MKKLPVQDLPMMPIAVSKEVEKLYFGRRGPKITYCKKGKSF